MLARGLLSLAQPLAEHHINEHMPSLGRATVLSGCSMAVSLVAIPLKFVSGPMADTLGLFTTVAVLGGILLVGASVLVAVSVLQTGVQE